MEKRFLKGAFFGGVFGIFIIFLTAYWNPSFVTVFTFLPSLLAMIVLGISHFIFKISILHLIIPFVYFFTFLFYVFVGLGIAYFIPQKKFKKEHRLKRERT